MTGTIFKYKIHLNNSSPHCCFLSLVCLYRYYDKSLCNSIDLYVLCLVTQSSLTLCDTMDCGLPGSSVHGDFSRQENRSGLPCPFPGQLPTQGSNPDLLLFRWILYHLSHDTMLHIKKY